MSIVIKPNPGPQTAFLSSSADIAIYGGAAGAGKSFALLLEPLRWITVKGFGGVFFRREMTQITKEGGLWDTSYDLYPHVGGSAVRQPLRWTFPKGAKFEFHHMQHEKSVRAWDGSQVPFFGFDELQSFTEKQFFYMLSRNRSLCGVKPYIRATCNPDPDSFLVRFLSWWIDPETGYPIKERSGVIRWFIRINGQLFWANTPEELIKAHGKESLPKSVTFIPAKVTDNVQLMQFDPGYMSNLKALLDYEKERLLNGNWFARPSAGDLFKRTYWKYVDAQDVPYMTNVVRYWDRAATKPSDMNTDPDWTVGVKMGQAEDGAIYILDVCRDRLEPFDVIEMVKNIAQMDGRDVTIIPEQDPGQAGKVEIGYFERALLGYNVEPMSHTGGLSSKLSRWKPLAVAAKAGNVYLVKAKWNQAFVNELEGCTDGSQNGHDDQTDAASGAYLKLTDVKFGVSDYSDVG